MINNEVNQLQEIQEQLLKLLISFNQICTENGIKYTLHAGTLLGAIREKGFIPWDDDADVAFMRSEYYKFKDVAINLEQKGLLPFKCDFSFGPRLILKDKGKPIVWLDVYIYDYISEKKFVQKLKILRLALLMGWMRDSQSMKITKAHKKYTGWKYLAINVLHYFGTPFSDETKFKVSQRVSQSMQGKKQYIHRANDQFVAIKLILPKRAMQNYMMVPFEDTNLMISTDYDEILRSSYGNDYMTPKKQVNDEESHAVFRSLQEK